MRFTAALIAAIVALAAPSVTATGASDAVSAFSPAGAVVDLGFVASQTVRGRLRNWLTASPAAETAQKLSRELGGNQQAIQKIRVELSNEASRLDKLMKAALGDTSGLDRWGGQRTVQRMAEKIADGSEMPAAIDDITITILAMGKQVDALKTLNNGVLPSLDTMGRQPAGFVNMGTITIQDGTLDLLDAIIKRTKLQKGRSASGQLWRVSRGGAYMSLEANQRANSIVSKLISGRTAKHFSTEELQMMTAALRDVNENGKFATPFHHKVRELVGSGDEMSAWVRGERAIPSTRARNPNPEPRKPKTEPEPDTPPVARAKAEAAERVVEITRRVNSARRRENKLLAMMSRADRRVTWWNFDEKAADVAKHFDDAVGNVRRFLDPKKSKTYRPSQFTRELMEVLEAQAKELDELRAAHRIAVGNPRARLPSGVRTMSSDEKKLLDELQAWWKGPPQPLRDFDGRYFSAQEMAIFKEIKDQGVAPVLSHSGKAEWVFRAVTHGDTEMSKRLRALLGPHKAAIRAKADAQSVQSSWDKLAGTLEAPPLARPSVTELAGGSGEAQRLFNKLRQGEDFTPSYDEQLLLSGALERTSWSPDDLGTAYHAGYTHPNEIKGDDVALVKALLENDAVTNRLFGSQWRTPTGAAAHEPTEDLLRNTWRD